MLCQAQSSCQCLLGFADFVSAEFDRSSLFIVVHSATQTGDHYFEPAEPVLINAGYRSYALAFLIQAQASRDPAKNAILISWLVSEDFPSTSPKPHKRYIP